jgi:hypothetical protein
MISHTIGWYVTDQNLKVSINSEKPITILMYNIASYKEFKIFFFFFEPNGRRSPSQKLVQLIRALQINVNPPQEKGHT